MQGRVDMSFRVRGSKGECLLSRLWFFRLSLNVFLPPHRLWRRLLHLYPQRSVKAIRDASLSSHSRFQQRNDFTSQRLRERTYHIILSLLLQTHQRTLPTFPFIDGFL